MNAPTINGADMFERCLPEIKKIFHDIPAFGSIGIEIQFNEWVPVSFKYVGSVTRLAKTTLGGRTGAFGQGSVEDANRVPGYSQGVGGRHGGN